MRLGVWIALAAALWLAAPAVAEEIPIWWSPTLGIEFLVGLDARLDEPFAPDDFREVFRVEIKNNRATIHDDVATDCRSLVRLVRAGYDAYGTKSVFRSFGERCFVFDALSRVLPANVSFFTDFELDPSVIPELPPLLRPVGYCGYLRDAMIANRDGTTWREFMDINDSYRAYRITGLHASGATVYADLGRYSAFFELYARGDFNGDGTEDLLLHTKEDFSYSDFDHLFLLVRDAPDSPIRIAWEYGVTAAFYARCEEFGYRYAKPDERPFPDPE